MSPLNLSLFIYFFIARVSLLPSDELMWVSVDGKTLCWLNQYKWSKMPNESTYMTRLGLMMHVYCLGSWMKKCTLKCSWHQAEVLTAILALLGAFFFDCWFQIPICLAAARPSCKVLWCLLIFIFFPSPTSNFPLFHPLLCPALLVVTFM